jgi:superfamily II DNA/RNA helicase
MSTTFEQLGVPAELTTVLSKRGIHTAFDIQTATIPDAMAGRDVSGRAATGSGKTLAFGIPMVARVGKARPFFPRALVLAPTRELAEQIQVELAPLARARGRNIMSIYGGVGYEPQRRAIRKGADIVVACPGRLADLVNQGDIQLKEVDFVVIDEADRMADMGFLPEVKRLLDQTASNRQTLLFSATLDGDIDQLTKRYQNDPARHEIGDPEPDITSMHHMFWRVESEDRMEHTAELIAAAGPTIVFSRTRHGADRIAKKLGHSGTSAASIHGGRSQNQRNRALESFKRGHVQALIATDVAARGIHIEGVACVLHFDPPFDDKTYVHRSGRTARAGASGVVVSFVSADQVHEARKLQRDLGLGTDEAPVSDTAIAIDQRASLANLERLTPAPAGSDRSQYNGSGKNSKGGSGKRRNRRGGPNRGNGSNANRSSSGGYRGNGHASNKRSAHSQRVGS